MTQRDDVFVFAGHGDKGSITFFNDEGENRGCLAINSTFADDANLGADRKYISMIDYNGLSHARAIISIENAEEQYALAQKRAHILYLV